MVTGDKEKKTTAKAVFAAESSGRQQAELERRLEEADKVFQERLQENNRMWQEIPLPGRPTFPQTPPLQQALQSEHCKS